MINMFKYKNVKGRYEFSLTLLSIFYSLKFFDSTVSDPILMQITSYLMTQFFEDLIIFFLHVWKTRAI